MLTKMVKNKLEVKKRIKITELLKTMNYTSATLIDENSDIYIKIKSIINNFYKDEYVINSIGITKDPMFLEIIDEVSFIVSLYNENTTTEDKFKLILVSLNRYGTLVRNIRFVDTNDTLEFLVCLLNNLTVLSEYYLKQFEELSDNTTLSIDKIVDLFTVFCTDKSNNKLLSIDDNVTDDEEQQEIDNILKDMNILSEEGFPINFNPFDLLKGELKENDYKFIIITDEISCQEISISIDNISSVIFKKVNDKLTKVRFILDKHILDFNDKTIDVITTEITNEKINSIIGLIKAAFIDHESKVVKLNNSEEYNEESE